MHRSEIRTVWVNKGNDSPHFEFSSITELLDVPFIKNWRSRDDFLGFSVLEYSDDNTTGLLVTHSSPEGITTRQIAYLSNGSNLDFSSVNKKLIDSGIWGAIKRIFIRKDLQLP